MSQKFNKFETLCERAFSHYSNGGFRTGTPVKLRPEFFKSKFYKQRYETDPLFNTWITDILSQNPNTFFFIKEVNGNSNNTNAKDANSIAGSDSVILVLSCDPRTVQYPTEFNEFEVPGDLEYIEVLNFGNNLPPVQGVPNKYEHPVGDTKARELKNDFDILNNRPLDDSLPKKNTSIPASPAKEKRYS
jgi:hypothetical protein